MKKILWTFNIPQFLGGGIFAIGRNIDYSLIRHSLWHLFITISIYYFCKQIIYDIIALTIAVTISLTWNLVTELIQGLMYKWAGSYFGIYDFIVGIIFTVIPALFVYY